MFESNGDKPIPVMSDHEDIRDVTDCCSWCPEHGVVWLMGQLFCEDCATRFRESHEKITTSGDRNERF